MARALRTGMDRETGQVLRGRAHAEQSVRVILSTRRVTRVMRLDFGSDLRALRGENMTAANVLRVYAELVEAVHSQEPNVRIRSVRPTMLDGRAGAIGFSIDYAHYPFGHLGDYSVVETASMSVPIGVIGRGSAAA